MYNNKKFLAIIPARSGSKGLKDKNIKELNGKPMIAHTIEAAIESDIFNEVVVSTDSQTYGDIAKKFGATVPFMRPDYLSNDTATSIDTIVHTIEELSKIRKEYDYFMLLQPTSPLRTKEDIINSIQLLFEKDANSVISVCEAEHSPLYMNTLAENLSMDGFLLKGIKTRRQELDKYYRINGAIYMCKVDYFLKYNDFYKEKSYAYVMDKKASVDIDDEIDFFIAESLMKQNYHNRV
ncbi:CMP-N-acetlyneuraminic acid synthetase [Tissierella sp. P1]|uniref:acylneuraminate cytidylyltransferase family protein n=1 Tax=Tissierella TaxID=41273 RepID=UPI000BA067BB|nr:acylneuraminate cytidylyltransferase family protein [Tissierella sp. P1]OZV13447.1 CMP-N-acetlyneuraminic acid synthetase [Tissierella sp. P1]